MGRRRRFVDSGAMLVARMSAARNGLRFARAMQRKGTGAWLAPDFTVDEQHELAERLVHAADDRPFEMADVELGIERYEAAAERFTLADAPAFVGIRRAMWTESTEEWRILSATRRRCGAERGYRGRAQWARHGNRGRGRVSYLLRQDTAD